MNKEEKEAIEQLKKVTYNNDYYTIDLHTVFGFTTWNNCFETILILIEKQQKEIEEKTTILFAGAEKVKQLEKEIEELKEKNKTLETLLQGTLYEMYLYYKELASKYQANSISKDKIRATIEDLEKHRIMYSDDFTIKVLKDLLGE